MGVSRKVKHKVEAGSMADIAFLLLIFFLVTTTIVADQGILTQLPPYEPGQITDRVPEHNVVNIKINAQNKILFENNQTQLKNIEPLILEQILNKGKLETMPTSPKNAVISLQNDRGTAYMTYISVYDQIKSAYSKLWDDEARKSFGAVYKNLPEKSKKEVRNAFPLTLSEAEPVDLALK